MAQKAWHRSYPEDIVSSVRHRDRKVRNIVFGLLFVVSLVLLLLSKIS